MNRRPSVGSRELRSNPPNVGLAVTLLFTCVIAATYAFGVYLFPALLAEMRQSLGFSYATAGTINAVRQVAFLLTALGCAAAVVRFGAAQVIAGSVVLCGICLCGLGLVGSTLLAAVLLIVLNACAASAWIPMVSLVAKVVAFRHRGKSVGLIASGTNYGLCLIGVLVPTLLAMSGWRSVWVAAGCLTLLLGVVVWLVLARANLMRPAAASTGSAASWRRAATRHYAVVYGIALLGGLSGVPFASYLSAFVRSELHVSAALAGQLWLAAGSAGAVGGMVFGALGDRLGLRAALLMAAALLSAAGVTISMSADRIALVMAAAGFGASFFSIFGLLPAYVGKTIAADLTPAVCGLVECALGIGGAVGSFLGGLAPHVLGTFRPVFVASACLAVAALLLTLRLPSEGRIRHQGAKSPG